jgi:hypothetical protein
LSASILFDNYNTIHLINSTSLLDTSTLKRLGLKNMIEAGISILLVIKCSKYIFKKYLKNKIDLVLSEIVIIKIFYINIISEVYLYKTRAWYNIVFLEYK